LFKIREILIVVINIILNILHNLINKQNYIVIIRII